MTALLVGAIGFAVGAIVGAFGMALAAISKQSDERAESFRKTVDDEVQRQRVRTESSWTEAQRRRARRRE